MRTLLTDSWPAAVRDEKNNASVSKAKLISRLALHREIVRENVESAPTVSGTLQSE
jgi:hypothetical protein